MLSRAAVAVHTFHHGGPLWMNCPLGCWKGENPPRRHGQSGQARLRPPYGQLQRKIALFAVHGAWRAQSQVLCV